MWGLSINIEIKSLIICTLVYRKRGGPAGIKSGCYLSPVVTYLLTHALYQVAHYRSKIQPHRERSLVLYPCRR